MEPAPSDCQRECGDCARVCFGTCFRRRPKHARLVGWIRAPPATFDGSTVGGGNIAHRSRTRIVRGVPARTLSSHSSPRAPDFNVVLARRLCAFSWPARDPPTTWRKNRTEQHGVASAANRRAATLKSGAGGVNPKTNNTSQTHVAIIAHPACAIFLPSTDRSNRRAIVFQLVSPERFRFQ